MNSMKKVKRICLSFVLFLYILPAMSQKVASPAEQLSMIEAIDKVASETKSIQCTFRQVKTLSILNEELVSTGIMLYSQPVRLRWQYQHPYTYTFIINGSQAMMKNPDQQHVIDTRQSKLLSEITQIMVNSVTGKCLTEKSDFNITMSSDEKEWIADLRPVKKELKAMFNVIKLHIDSKKCIITQVELIEKTGDQTRIYLSDYKVNVDIDEKMFRVD